MATTRHPPAASQPAPRSASLLAQADSELLQRIHQREEAALLVLYHRYSSLVYGLALRVLQNPTPAEEVTQDIFLKIWQRPERWNPAAGQFSSWLLTITRNAAIDRLRRERHGQTQTLEQLEAHGAATQTAEGQWYDGQLLATLLEELPPEQRQLIELAFFQGYTHSELSEKLELPLGTVKTRLRSGLQKLRALWKQATA
jgi:RNA polymerase sigma-70 factor (ECF subfamily)